VIRTIRAGASERPSFCSLAAISASIHLGEPLLGGPGVLGRLVPRGRPDIGRRTAASQQEGSQDQDTSAGDGHGHEPTSPGYQRSTRSSSSRDRPRPSRRRLSSSAPARNAARSRSLRRGRFAGSAASFTTTHYLSAVTAHSPHVAPVYS
jgi:hypothetical protein